MAACRGDCERWKAGPTWENTNMSQEVSDARVAQIYNYARSAVIGWEPRMSRLETPLPGSELEADDKALMGHVPSELARLALTSGTEALQLVRESLDAGRVYASATNGPIRTALLAASHVVFQLGPDDADVRRERQRFAQRAYYSNMSAYFRERSDPDPRVAEMLKGNDAKIKALNDILGYTKSGKPRPATSDTRVVAEAAERFGEPNATTLREHWRRLSGDAHALGWQLLLDGVEKHRETGHMFEGMLSSKEANTYRHFVSAAEMLRRGWSLFDQRCSDD